jgi:hypothetical protein
MKNIKINRERLFELYMDEVHRISEENEDKSHFTPEELIGIVSNVLETNPKLITEKGYSI